MHYLTLLPYEMLQLTNYFAQAYASVSDAKLLHAQGRRAADSLPPVAKGLSTGTRRALAAWLGVCSAWVASLVVLGGMTRLTRSGLSMTDWKFTGEAPPQSQVTSRRALLCSCRGGVGTADRTGS